MQTAHRNMSQSKMPMMQQFPARRLTAPLLWRFRGLKLAQPFLMQTEALRKQTAPGIP
nr:MAG TPA: hypothetical protein [Bacteriophage sp.]